MTATRLRLPAGQIRHTRTPLPVRVGGDSDPNGSRKILCYLGGKT
jgi:hypothetical protein